MAEARRRAVQRRSEQSVRTVEVQDGVAAGDVERERVVELEALVGYIRCDAGVGDEARGPDYESLGGGGDGGDWVGVVEGVEDERARVAPDLVRLVAARGGCAERVGHGGVAAVWAALDAQYAPGVR